MKRSELRRIIKEHLTEFNLKGIQSGTKDASPADIDEDILSRVSDIIEIGRYLEKKHGMTGISIKLFNQFGTKIKLNWNFSEWTYKK